jgi:hypothetical protein
MAKDVPEAKLFIVNIGLEVIYSLQDKGGDHHSNYEEGDDYTRHHHKHSEKFVVAHGFSIH